MATLKTRIQLKYDTLANWSKTDVAGKGGNLVLKSGEVGFVQVPTGATAEQVIPPAILMKVGDGTTAFKDLPWVSGAAADVYPWAKAATKPSYNYSEIKNTPTIPSVGNGSLTIKVGANGTTNGTGSFTANQSTAGTITLPVYTKEEVDAKVVGAVQYLGTVASATELAALNPNSVGDFCRVSTAFGSYHVGDLLLCKTLKSGNAAATWDVVHGEIDKNT